MKLGDVEEGPVSLTWILTCKFTVTQHNVCWLSIIQADSTYSVQTHQSDHIFSYCCFCLVAESCPTLPCPPLSSWVCSNSLPLSQWCYPTISLCCTPLLLPSIFPNIRVSSNKLALCIRWPKYWNFSFSISHSNESGLISFRIDWLHLFDVQGIVWPDVLIIQPDLA